MERPGAAADGLSRRPHGVGLLLLLLLSLLPLATLGQDRLDSPPSPAAPLSRWAGPVGVSWGLRAAAPGGLFPRGGRWRRSEPQQDEDEDCGRVRDFVARLTNNTHQVSGRRARASLGPRGAAPSPGAPMAVRPARVLCVFAEGTPAARRNPGRGPKTAAGGVRPGEWPRDVAVRAALSSQGEAGLAFQGIFFFPQVVKIS